MTHTSRAIIDLHCDTLSECYAKKLALSEGSLQFSLSKPPEGFRLCQAMAVYVPDGLRGGDAEEYFDGLCALFREQMKLFSGLITPVEDVSAIGAALERTPFAAILTAEGGGAAINGKPENVARFHAMGVRMMSLSWNAANDLCGGCATNLGFTRLGRTVIKEMERTGIAVDVSHLSDRAFWELCDIAEKPFAASHSNSRAVCGHRRNLTDNMFKEIVRRDGVAGLNFFKNFIREDGLDGSVDDLLRHVYHFLELGGEDAIALGSDFDGARTPDYLSGADKFAYLAEALDKARIPAGVSDKILYKNAENFFVRLGRRNNELHQHTQ